MNTTQSELLFEKSKSRVPGGVHSPVRAFKGVGGTPRFIQSAAGAELVDVDQNRYVDFCMSWGPLILGHKNPDVCEQLHQALERGWTYGTAEPYSYELVELITNALPWVEKIRFVSSGTEAVMSALRIARAATGRNKILKFDGCYHGHVDSMLIRAGSGMAELASSDSAGVSNQVASDTVVVPLNDLSLVEKAFQLHGSEIAAVIYEGIPANNGLLLQKDNFLPEVARLARQAGSLLILDEVITGFRIGFGGIVEETGVRPDLVTYGKIIGGGFPVGAFGGRADLMDWIAPVGQVYQAGTLSGNPIAMVAGFATLQKLKRENPYAELRKRTENLALAIEAVGRETHFPIHVQRHASIFQIIFGKPLSSDGYVRALTEAPPEAKGIYARIYHKLLEKGIYLAPSAFEVSFLSTAHQENHLNQLVEALRESIREIQSTQ